MWYSNYSWTPAKLFDEVNRPLAIFISKPAEKAMTHSTNYQKWNSENRPNLMDRVSYIQVSRARPDFWVPKLGDVIELEILRKVLATKTSFSHFISKSSHKIYYRKTGGLYWKVFTDFPPRFRKNGVDGHSSREASFSAAEQAFVKPMIGVLSSNLYWWWYTITSSLRDLNPSDIYRFPLSAELLHSSELTSLASKYLKDIRKNSSMKTRQQKTTGKTETQTFNIKLSKKIIDEIDRVLGPRYGLSEEEIDFIINYDIKYRMSSDNDD